MTEVKIIEAVLIFLAAGVVTVALVQRLSISPIVGYLVAGILIGPKGLGIVKDFHMVEDFAHVGIVFLLFSVGLELTFARVTKLWHYMFGIGLLQVSLCGISITLISYYFLSDIKHSIVVGGSLALSSTALCLQLLKEKNERTKSFGQKATAILLFQDLAVVPMLVLAPLFTKAQFSIARALFLASIKAVIALLLIWFIGRVVLRPVYRVIAATRLPELMTATTLFVVLGTAFITASAGLSLALGAFLAGLLVAETEYTYQFEADVQPFRGILLGLFFMTVGMGIDFVIIYENFSLILAVLFGLLSLKIFIVLMLGLIFRLPFYENIRISFLLSQGGEFAFILLGASAIDNEFLHQVVTTVVVLSLFLTPLLNITGTKIARWLTKKPEDKSFIEPQEIKDHVLFVGFGRFGQYMARVVTNAGKSIIALDKNSSLVFKLRSSGLPVYLANALAPGALRSAHADSASSIVVAIDDHVASLHIVSLLKAHYPNQRVFCRAKDHAHLKKLNALGAQAVVIEVAEASLQLSSLVLRNLGIPEGDIEEALGQYRQNDYKALILSRKTTIV